MQGRDLHSALKTEVVERVNAGRAEVIKSKLQWGKDDVGYSLHVNPNSYTSAGLQITDFLGYLGFQRNDRCSFTSGQRCYAKWIDGELSLQEFATALNGGFAHLEKAERSLGACGFLLDQPEGWGYYFGKSGGSGRRTLATAFYQSELTTQSSMGSCQSDTFR